MPIMSAKEMDEEKKLLDKRKLAEQIEELLELCAELAEKMGVDVSSIKVPKKKRAAASTGEEKMSHVSEISMKMGAHDPELENKKQAQERREEPDHECEGIEHELFYEKKESPSIDNSAELESENVEYCPETVMGDEIAPNSLGVSSTVGSERPAPVPLKPALPGLSSTYSVSDTALPPGDHLPTRRMSVPQVHSAASVDVPVFEELVNKCIASSPPTPGVLPVNIHSEAEANELLMKRGSVDNSAISAKNCALEEGHEDVRIENAPTGLGESCGNVLNVEGKCQSTLLEQCSEEANNKSRAPVRSVPENPVSTKEQATDSNSCSASLCNDVGSSSHCIFGSILARDCNKHDWKRSRYVMETASEATSASLFRTNVFEPILVEDIDLETIDLVELKLTSVVYADQAFEHLLKAPPKKGKSKDSQWRYIGGHDLFRIIWRDSVNFRLELPQDFKKRKKRLRGKKKKK